jgi:hypothetical protein
MKTIDKTYTRSKLGKLLDERNLTLKEFAALVYDKTGYFIAITNLSNYCTGLRRCTNIRILQHFADTLEVPINDIL